MSDFSSKADFEGKYEYEAYVLTCFAINLLPCLDPDTTFELILSYIDRDGGFDPYTSSELGALLRSMGMSGASHSEETH